METFDTSAVHALSQDEWDEIHKLAQRRRNRAQSLQGRGPGSEDSTSPTDQGEVNTSAQTPLFNNAFELLQRFGSTDVKGRDLPLAQPGKGDRKPRHLVSVAPPESAVDEWNEPVDWTECVALDLSEQDQEIELRDRPGPRDHWYHDEPTDIFDLREREIALRNGRILFDEYPRPATMVDLRRSV